MDPQADEVRGLEPDIIEHEVHEQRHPVHGRSTPLPKRVKVGKVTEQTLQFFLPDQELIEFPWDQIELMALGLIEEAATDVSGPKGAMRQMFGKLTGKASENEERKTRQVREIYLLDVYIKNHDQPFRMDSATVNYKSFLGADMSYVSFQNFFRLATRLARHAVNARFDEALVAFFTRRKDGVKKFPAVYDYELELQQSRQKLEHLATHDQLKLDRETWAEEWGEYS